MVRGYEQYNISSELNGETTAHLDAVPLLSNPRLRELVNETNWYATLQQTEGQRGARGTRADLRESSSVHPCAHVSISTHYKNRGRHGSHKGSRSQR